MLSLIWIVEGLLASSYPGTTGVGMLKEKKYQIFDLKITIFAILHGDFVSFHNRKAKSTLF